MIGDVALSPDGRLILRGGPLSRFDRGDQSAIGMVIEHFRTGRRPYRILFHPDGKSFFVTSWADGTLGHYDASSGNELTRVPLGAHPTDILWRNGAPHRPGWGRAQVYCAALCGRGQHHSVYSVAVNSAKDLSVVERINIAMTPRQPLGMTPSALALSPDGKRLFVACSDGMWRRWSTFPARSAAWKASSHRLVSHGGARAGFGNASGGQWQGLRSYPNPNGPSPRADVEPVHGGVREPGYVAYLQTGTASWIAPFTDRQLADVDEKALSLSAYRDSKLDVAGRLPPQIQHVLYIEKENRTYDQVLGDMKEGNGDASLVLFGENVTPNLHKLAREFVLLDNFYVNAE